MTSPLSVGVLPGESRDDAASADPPPGDGPDGVAGSSPPSSSLSVTTLMVPSLETSDDAWLIIDARFASFRRNCCIAGLNLQSAHSPSRATCRYTAAADDCRLLSDVGRRRVSSRVGPLLGLVPGPTAR